MFLNGQLPCILFFTITSITPFYRGQIVLSNKYSLRALYAGSPASWTLPRRRRAVCGRWERHTLPGRHLEKNRPTWSWWMTLSTQRSPRRWCRADCPRPAWCSSHLQSYSRPATPGQTTQPSGNPCSIWVEFSSCGSKIYIYIYKYLF